MGSAIEVRELTKTFRGGKVALNGVSLTIEDGEMVALIGASGSGKSTLLRHLAGLLPGDRAGSADRVGNRNEVVISGNSIQAQGRIARNAPALRAEVGFVFQQFNLVDRLSVLTNVLLGLLGRVPRWRGSLALFTRAEKLRAYEALKRVGIEETAMRRASTLSGGQQQRAAIARTLVQQARVILADEPIASLDPASSQVVMEALSKINREDGTTVVTSLHQVDYAKRFCPRTVALRNGSVVFDGPSSDLSLDLLQELYGAQLEELFGSEQDLNRGVDGGRHGGDQLAAAVGD